MAATKPYLVTNVAGDRPDVAGQIRQVGSTIYLTAAQAAFEISRGVIVDESPATGPAAVVPLYPDRSVQVTGTPDPNLALTFGFALDLTSVPNALYKWSGTAWLIILQAGSGGTPAPSIPANTALPAISGTAQVGQTLTCSSGTWTGSPTSYAYQWQRNGSTIQGATAATYAPVSGDIGATLTCSVTASNASGASQPAISSSTSAVTAAATVAPGAISAAPTLSAASTSSLSIAWLAPATGGAPADYLVQYRVTGSAGWTTADQGGTSLSATIPGLSAATSYDVQIIATNSAGQGAASPTLTASTTAADADRTITTDLSNPDRGLSPLIN